MITKRNPPPSPLKETVAKHLRAADNLAKEGRLDNAVLEIQKALKLDPRNYYARSFLDRVQVEIEKARQKDSKTERKAAEDEERRIEFVSQCLRKADQFIAAKDYRAALQEVAQVYKIDPNNHFATSYSDRIEILMRQETSPGAKPGQIAAKSPAPPATPPPTGAGTTIAEPPRMTGAPLPAPGVTELSGAPGSTEKGSLVMYRQMLKEMWADGKITPEEDQELRKVRQLFNITDTEHADAEKQVHIEAYVDALKIAWRDGVISPTENAVLELMRQKYNITLEEHMSAEAKILWARNNNALAKGTILIVDDDRTLLLTLAAQLKKHGYNTVTADKIEKAIKLLDQVTPHLVLSDLMFGPGEMTGLEFYQHVRNHPNFKQLPFLLMSGISDEFVFRAGVRMGIDDFLAKPFSLELLLATIEGKLNSGESG